MPHDETSLENELLHCPFCGSEADIYETEYDLNIDERYWVRCDNCDSEQRGFYTKEDAIEKWNTRINDKNK
jgi:Lar family restriction alleviation protein